MMAIPPQHPTKQSGMTLIEVVLAIAVAAFVLTAATSFVVSVSSIWAERESRNFYEDHVDGVTEFLKAAFSKAGVSISTGEDGAKTENQGGNNGSSGKTESDTGNAASGLVRTSETPIAWTRLPGAGNYEDPLLNFKLTEMPLLFTSAQNLPTVGGVDVFLHFEKETGLSLLWYSILQEEVDDIRDLQRTEISPLVKELKYIYWDERFEQWEEEDEPKKGEGDEEYVLPRYIKLVFEHEGVTKERTLTIPIPSLSAFLF